MYARRAKELGIPISINTDSHSEGDFDMLFYGVATARRAWLTKNDVINAWSTKKLLDWLKKRAQKRKYGLPGHLVGQGFARASGRLGFCEPRCGKKHNKRQAAILL
jgi:hypothetical protein